MSHVSSLVAVVLLAGCVTKEAPHEDIRPVRTQLVTADAGAAEANYAGEVRARREVKLGFRIGGKITARFVELGQSVKAGTPLFQLDPQDTALQASAAQSQVSAAKAQAVQAKQDLDRARQLLDKGFVSQAEVDRRIAAADAADATLKAAESTARVAGNQSRYTVLQADRAGVITALDAEVGQVVAAGTPVAGLAEAGEREVVVNVPESRLDEIRNAKALAVVLWAKPDKRFEAKLRELAASADPQSRTYTARISLLNPDDDVRLGMTANVLLAAGQKAGRSLLPLSAVDQQANAARVWVVDSASSTVRARAVQLGEIRGDQIEVVAGVKPGETVVTAGAHLLHDQQKVRLAESQFARK